MKLEFKHLMLDIETMGNESYSSIVSIGAVEFDITNGATGREFYRNICLQSCIDIGLQINASTVIWWMGQSEQARKSLTDGNAITIQQALIELTEFIGENRYKVWGNSARFDCGILQNAYSKLGQPIPWRFYNERCVRTLVSFAPDIKKNYPAPLIAHNALHDCHYQIGYCTAIWSTLNLNPCGASTY